MVDKNTRFVISIFGMLIAAGAILVATVLCAPAQDYYPEWRPDSRLYGAWPMTGRRGNVFGDETGNSHLIYSYGGTVAAGTGQLDFDGVDDYATIPSFPNIAPPFTISFWWKSNSAQTTRASMVAKNTEAGFTGWYIHQFNNTDLAFYIETNGSNYRGLYASGLVAGQWRHIVCVADSTSQLRMYSNGALIDDTEDVGGTVGSITTYEPLRLSAKTTSNQTDSFVIGSISDLQILNSALTADEILGLYITGRNGTLAP